MNIVPIRLAFGAAAVTAVLAAGSGAALATPTPSAATSIGRSAFAIHTVSQRVVAAPVIRPGWVHVRNTGRHPILLLTARHSASVATLVREMNDSNGDAGFAHLLRDFSFVDILSARRDAYLRMPRGSYFLLDATLEKFTKAKVTTTRVTGAYANAATLTPKYARVATHGIITAPATVTQKRYVQFANRSARLQEIMLVPVGKKVTSAQLNKFLAHPSFGDLATVAPSFNIVLVAVLSPGRVATTRVGVSPGRHLVFSFSFPLTTTSDGAPTIRPGQIRLVTVSA